MMNGMGGDQLSMSCRAPRTITTCGSVKLLGLASPVGSVTRPETTEPLPHILIL